jgi:hypothetical protein
MDLYCKQCENGRANFCKNLYWKPSFGVLYGMYTAPLNALKYVSEVINAQAGQNAAVNITSVESTAQDNASGK